MCIHPGTLMVAWMGEMIESYGILGKTKIEWLCTLHVMILHSYYVI